MSMCAALLLFLSVAACHRGEKKEPDMPMAPVEETQPQKATRRHGGGFRNRGSSPFDTRDFMINRDSVETTNRGFFSRKKVTNFSPELLEGEWRRGGEHEEYMSDGSGLYWDTDEDVRRDEAKIFTWTLDSNRLTFTYDIELGGKTMRQYYVTYVDGETLVYKDAHGDSYVWDKVPSKFNDRPSARTLDN